MAIANPMRDDLGESQVVDTQIHLLERVLRQAKFLLFICGLVLLLAGWSMGSQSIANQNIAIARGLTACGLLFAGGLSFVAAAIMYHRDGAFTTQQAIRSHR